MYRTDDTGDEWHNLLHPTHPGDLFRRKELKSLLGRLLFPRQGMRRKAFLHNLEQRGRIESEAVWFRAPGGHARMHVLRIEKVTLDDESARYRILIHETCLTDVLATLNHTHSWRFRRKKSRRQSPQKPHAGDNGKMRRLFSKRKVKLHQAVEAIAYTRRASLDRIQNEIFRSLQLSRGSIQNTVATINLTPCFACRIELPQSFRGLLDYSGEIVLRVTADNTHPGYRRLRQEMRRILEIPRRRARTHKEKEYTQERIRYRRM